MKPDLEAIQKLQSHPDVLDWSTFEQILEMDDDEDESGDFSRTLVVEFTGQADDQFMKMDEDLAKGDLPGLSAKGHFLKGSSATLGLNQLKDACEKIQHLGARMDETGSYNEPNDQKTLSRLQEVRIQAEVEFAVGALLLSEAYGLSYQIKNKGLLLGKIKAHAPWLNLPDETQVKGETSGKIK